MPLADITVFPKRFEPESPRACYMVWWLLPDNYGSSSFIVVPGDDDLHGIIDNDWNLRPYADGLWAWLRANNHLRCERHTTTKRKLSWSSSSDEE